MIYKDPDHVPSELTEREQEILRYLATGTSNKEIAARLVISSNTVKVHLRNIFAKIGVASRTEAAMYAVRIGLVQGGQSTGVAELATSPEPSVSRSHPWHLSRRWAILLTGILALAIAGLAMVLDAPSLPVQPTVTNAPQASEVSRWKSLADLPTTPTGMAAAVYEGELLVIGGETSRGVTGVVERYDVEKDSWSAGVSKPLPVTDVNAAVVGGRVYVPGGLTASGTPTDRLDIYDPQADTWEQGAALPVPLSAYGLVAFEGRLYLFGGLGMDPSHCLNTVYIYSPDQDRWSEGSPMPTARAFAGAAAAADKIYVMGGYDGRNALTANEVYIPRLDGHGTAWQPAAALPAGSYDMGITSIADLIYLLGGKGEAAAVPGPALFLAQTGKWQSFDATPEDIGADVKLVSLGEYIYVLGGKNAGNGYTLRYQAVYMVAIPLVP